MNSVKYLHNEQYVMEDTTSDMDNAGDQDPATSISTEPIIDSDADPENYIVNEQPENVGISSEDENTTISNSPPNNEESYFGDDIVPRRKDETLVVSPSQDPGSDNQQHPESPTHNEKHRLKSSLKTSTKRDGRPEKASISFGGTEEKPIEKSRIKRSVGFAEAAPSRPKPRPQKSESKRKDSSGGQSTPEKVPNSPSGSRLEWYEDLGDTQINMFKQDTTSDIDNADDQDPATSISTEPIIDSDADPENYIVNEQPENVGISTEDENTTISNSPPNNEESYFGDDIVPRRKDETLVASPSQDPASDNQQHPESPTHNEKGRRKFSLKTSTKRDGNPEKASMSFGGTEEKTIEKSRIKLSVGFAEAAPTKPKPRPKKNESKGKDSSGGQSTAEKVPNIPSGSRPEWYEDLGDTQINMFKQVFELLDRDGGGSISVTELYSCLKDLDIDISLDEIRKVLEDLDSDGNGEIDFDEFLYAMSSTDRYLTMLQNDTGAVEKYSRRQTLFFTAITRFAMKNSLGDIERYYAQKMRQAPHVISCYTAGARLIGLNDRQLEKELRRMQRAAKDQDSPYAKPLPFVQVRPKKKKKKPQPSLPKSPSPTEDAKTKDDTPHSDRQRSSSENGDDVEQPGQKPQSSGSNEHDDDVLFQQQMQQQRLTAFYSDGSDSEILETLKALANSGNVIARIPDVHLIPQIRNKLAKTKKTDPTVLCSSLRKKRKTRGLDKPCTAEESQIKRHQVDRPKVSKPHGWRIPCIERGRAPMPIIKLSLDRPKVSKPHGWKIPCIERAHTPMPIIKVSRTQTYTIEDVAIIRKKVSDSIDQYYHELKKSLVKTAWDTWDQLHADEIPSESLRENFRRVYASYYPHTLQDVFTIAPWIPGPRYSTNPAGQHRPHSTGNMKTRNIYQLSQTKATHHGFTFLRPTKAANGCIDRDVGVGWKGGRKGQLTPTPPPIRPPSRARSQPTSRASTPII